MLYTNEHKYDNSAYADADSEYDDGAYKMGMMMMVSIIRDKTDRNTRDETTTKTTFSSSTESFHRSMSASRPHEFLLTYARQSLVSDKRDLAKCARLAETLKAYLLSFFKAYRNVKIPR